MFRKTIILLVGLNAAAALAQTPSLTNGARCVQRTSHLDGLINPARGSDEKFFTSGSGKPNVMFILDTSGSMNYWPEHWPTNEGCNHTGFAGNGYDPDTNYRGIVDDINADGSPHYRENWFRNDRAYFASGTGWSGTAHPFGTNLANNPGQPSGWGGGKTFNDACNTLHSADTTRANNCRTCLDTRGYYIKNATDRVAAGNFLKYYPPRDVAALMVLSQMIYDVRGIRLGIMTFHNWTGSGNNCWNGQTGTSGNACIWERPEPDCDPDNGDDTESAIETQRKTILNKFQVDRPFPLTRTPLSTNLYAAMYYMRGPGGDNVFDKDEGGFNTTTYVKPTNGTVFATPNSGNNKSICSGCSFNAVVLLTDGEPSSDNPGTLPARITSNAGITNITCTGTWCANYLDEIAGFFWQHADVRDDYPNRQKVATYTIGFGTDTATNSLLQSAATAGGGAFYPAKNAAAIVSALTTIFDDIVSRNNSFASASVASVQTGGSSTPAVMARVLPREGETWRGKLWRFNQFNEFVEDRDLNGDGDKNDIFITENAGANLPDGGRPETSANIVTEDANGEFINSGGAAATPFWEANHAIVSGAGACAIGTGCVGLENRKIWTVIDDNDQGKTGNSDGAFTHHDSIEELKFARSAIATIGSTEVNRELGFASYMGLRNNAEYCPSASGVGRIVAGMGSIDQQVLIRDVTRVHGSKATLAALTQDESDLLCVRLVMMWARGYDLFDSKPGGLAGGRLEPRDFILGDIFHSSPINVVPPAEPFLCELGLAPQCVPTLFKRGGLLTEATPVSAALVDRQTTVPGCTGTKTREGPYETWQAANSARQNVIIVGANDGMIHAFNNGTATPTCAGNNYAVPNYNQGDGSEIWALIPPDQLPRLASQMFSHQYMIDGDTMVRDIWADGSGSSAADGVKQKDEFHTLAVVAQGRGGNHYIATELQFNAAGLLENKPGFRWMFPQPCSEEAATFGKTLLQLSPKQPPILPVLLEREATVTGAVSNAPPRYGADNTVERWVVGLTGGWSPGLERGRGVYIVDAWEGQIGGRRDNLLWKFEFDDNAATPANHPARAAKYSVAAPMALVDYGRDELPGQDGYVDTAVWGDTGGQVWVARLHAPGKFDTTTKLISNWSAARTLEMDRDGAPSAGDPGAVSITNKHPFYYLPEVVIEPGTNRMRVLIGSGNRYALMEEKAGMCRFDNPAACSKYGCDNTRVDYRYRDGITRLGGMGSDGMSTNWKNRSFVGASLNRTTAVGPEVIPLTSQPAEEVVARMRTFETGTCGAVGNRQINESRYECRETQPDVAYTCERISDLRHGGLEDLYSTYTTLDETGLGHNRFMGFWAYGGRQVDGGVRYFTGDGGLTPEQFDATRLDDRTELVDVTSLTTCVVGTDCAGAPLNGPGWVMDYDGLEYKTATGAGVIASCALWSDISPTGGSGGACGAAVLPMSRLNQAHVLTGAPNCIASFSDGGVYVRSVERTVVAPPPEPAVVVQVSKTGERKWSAMVVEPGQDQATTADDKVSRESLQVVYELPVSRGLHNCRHTADGNCVVAP